MDCPRLLDVSLFYDGDLTPEEAEDVRHHLAVCDECSDFLVDVWMLEEMWAQRPKEA